MTTHKVGPARSAVLEAQRQLTKAVEAFIAAGDDDDSEFKARNAAVDTLLAARQALIESEEPRLYVMMVDGFEERFMAFNPETARAHTKSQLSQVWSGNKNTIWKYCTLIGEDGTDEVVSVKIDPAATNLK